MFGEKKRVAERAPTIMPAQVKNYPIDFTIRANDGTLVGRIDMGFWGIAHFVIPADDLIFYAAQAAKLRPAKTTDRTSGEQK